MFYDIPPKLLHTGECGDDAPGLAFAGILAPSHLRQCEQHPVDIGHLQVDHRTRFHTSSRSMENLRVSIISGCTGTGGPIPSPWSHTTTHYASLLGRRKVV